MKKTWIVTSYCIHTGMFKG